MFGKKKQTLFNGVNDSMTITNDFCLRTSISGFESYRTCEYRLFFKLTESEMIPKLDEHLDKLFSGDLDDGNADVLDGLIFSVSREAAADLDRQHSYHLDTIRRLICRRVADREDVRQIRETREAELQSLKAEYEKLCQMKEV
jgi:hypothetical protein